MNRLEAEKQIQEIRDTLSYDDAESPMLVEIVRDLWDGYPLADVQGAAKQLILGDYDAEKKIKAIVAQVEPYEEI